MQMYPIFLFRPLKLKADIIELIAFPGELFMNSIKLLTVPLIVSSLIAGANGFLLHSHYLRAFIPLSILLLEFYHSKITADF